MKLNAFVSDREMQRAVERAIQLMNAGRPGPAWRLMRDVDVRRPNNFDILHVWGSALVLDERFEDGIRVLNKAAALKPDAPAVWMNIAGACKRAGKPAAALEALANALRANPNLIDASHDKTLLLLDLGRLEEAAAQAENFVTRFPTDAIAQLSLGVVRTHQGRTDDAIQAFSHAAEIAPTNMLAKANLGFAFAAGRRYAEAAGALKQVVASQPNNAAALEKLIFIRRALCDWEGLEAQQQALITMSEQASIDPWTLFSISDDPALLKKVAARRIAVTSAQLPPPLFAKTRAAGARLRIAYLSADLRHEPATLALANLIAGHDRNHVEATGISFGPEPAAPLLRQLTDACHQMLDVSARPPADIAKTIADLGIDIAIDVSGPGSRVIAETLAMRPAPVQVSYLGYPGTTAAPWIDYIIADHVTIPPGDERNFTESVVRLAGSVFPAARKPVPAGTATRKEHGLPEKGTVFAAFSASWKISPAVFDTWMDIVRACEQSVLWLRSDDEMTGRNLKREAEKRGVEPGRIVLAPRLESADQHLARLALADLVLDTTPFTARASVTDAISAGVPLLTLPGRSFASRMAASLLSAAGLEELLARDMESYATYAKNVGNDPALLASIRARVAAARDAGPLLDLQHYVRSLERALTIMHERSRKGQPADAITISAALH
ncbi:MAG: tetratricopeptide repeat protein [Hyphomicrobiaceae bacterium]